MHGIQRGVRAGTEAAPGSRGERRMRSSRGRAMRLPQAMAPCRQWVPAMGAAQNPSGMPKLKKATSSAVQANRKAIEYGSIISSMSPKPISGRYLRMKARMTPA